MKGGRLAGRAGPGSLHDTSAYQGGYAEWVKENIVSNQCLYRKRDTYRIIVPLFGVEGDQIEVSFLFQV